MIQTYPQVGPSRLSGDADEWRILIRWEEGAPAALYTFPQALGEAERLQEAYNYEVAQAIRQAAEQVPLDWSRTRAAARDAAPPLPQSIPVNAETSPRPTEQDRAAMADVNERTRQRAFEIWERQGKSGDPVEHWIQVRLAALRWQNTTTTVLEPIEEPEGDGEPVKRADEGDAAREPTNSD